MNYLIFNGGAQHFHHMSDQKKEAMIRMEPLSTGTVELVVLVTGRRGGILKKD